MRKASVFFLFVFAITMIFLSQNFYGKENVIVKKYVVALQDVNVRALPSIKGEIVFVAKKGERMEFLGNERKWVKVKKKNGLTGYVSSKFIRIEVEKTIIKEIKENKTETRIENKVNNMNKIEKKENVKSPSDNGKKNFELNLILGGGLVNPDDLNTPVDGMNKFISSGKEYGELVGETVEVTDGLKKVQNVLGGGIEAKYYFNNNFGINLGMEMYSKNVSGKSELKYTTSNYYYASTVDLKSKIYSPYIGLTYSVLGDIFSFDIYGNIGYFIGKFNLRYEEQESDNGSTDTYWEDITDVNKSSIGFIGGVKGKINLNEKFGIFMAVNYRMVKFKDLDGKMKDSQGKSFEGKLYYLENDVFGTWIPFVDLYEEEPNYYWMRNVRLAEFDFSGVYIGGGIFFYF